jgi:methylated-DNA-[protein]-cysteine S-methyltransferase
MTRYRVVETKWGQFGFVWSDNGLLATYLPQKSHPATEKRLTRDWPDARKSERGMSQLATDIRDYFNGEDVDFEVEFDMEGMTEFRRNVMLICADIPQGETVSYRELASRAGRPGASRAAGSVMAKNPFPLVVPCHRVVASDGKLGGFSSDDGISQKQRLLRHEGVALDRSGCVPIMV